MSAFKTISRYISIFFMVFVVLNVFQIVSSAQNNVPRYMIMQNQMIFERVDVLPYEILGEMCWNSTEGWCDEGMEDAGHRLVYLFDFETAQHGVVMENEVGCWIWWFLPTYGEDNNPHIGEHYWITCPEPLEVAGN